MGLSTHTFSVDGTLPPDPVIVQGSIGAVRTVIIYEDAQLGSTDYDVYAPTADATPVRRPAGAKTEFHAGDGKFFEPGAIIGYVNAATAGSYTFAQEEHS